MEGDLAPQGHLAVFVLFVITGVGMLLTSLGEDANDTPQHPTILRAQQRVNQTRMSIAQRLRNPNLRV